MFWVWKKRLPAGWTPPPNPGVHFSLSDAVVLALAFLHPLLRLASLMHVAAPSLLVVLALLALVGVMALPFLVLLAVLPTFALLMLALMMALPLLVLLVAAFPVPVLPLRPFAATPEEPAVGMKGWGPHPGNWAPTLGPEAVAGWPDGGIPQPGTRNGPKMIPSRAYGTSGQRQLCAPPTSTPPVST